MGPTFSFDIHRCTTKAPRWNNVATEMEGMKKKTRLKSTQPQREWEIEIHLQDDSETDLILDHFNDCYGINGDIFLWERPDFFGGGSYYVRYKTFDYSNPEGLGTHWDFTISFEEEVSYSSP